MATINQIRLSGLGGHGVVFAGTVLGKAAIAEGKWVSGANAYGSQARGGLTRADLVISDHPIAFPHILETDVLIAFSLSAYQAYVSNVNPANGLIFFDRSRLQPDDNQPERLIGFDITDRVLQELDSKQIVNIALLGAVAAVLKIVSLQALQEAVRLEVPAPFTELNQKALVLGHRLGEAVK